MQQTRTTHIVRMLGAMLAVVASTFLIALWQYSYHDLSVVRGPLPGANGFQINSINGRLELVQFGSEAPVDWACESIAIARLDPPNDQRSHQADSQRIAPPSHVVPSSPNVLLGTVASARLGFGLQSFSNSTSISIPFSVFVLITAAAAAVLGTQRRMRFSLQSMLIAMAFVAFTLGVTTAMEH